MKNKERIEQLENRIEALENHFAKTNKTIEPNLITDWLSKHGKPEIEAKVTHDLLGDSDVKKNFTTENSERTETALNEQEATKTSDKECSAPNNEQTDWENLLSEEDFRAPSYMTWYDRRNNLNKLLHERTKPLLDENAELRQRIEELEAEKANQIYVPVALDGDGDLKTNLYSYCKLNGIDQTKIKRITLTMREE